MGANAAYWVLAVSAVASTAVAANQPKPNIPKPPQAEKTPTIDMARKRNAADPMAMAALAAAGKNTLLDSSMSSGTGTGLLS